MKKCKNQKKNKKIPSRTNLAPSKLSDLWDNSVFLVIGRIARKIRFIEQPIYKNIYRITR